MIQLWLGGKRIDSIPMLREAFSSRTVEEQIKLCRELLKKKDDFFLKWIAYCPEMRLASNHEIEQDRKAGIESLLPCRKRLEQSEDDALTEEDFEAIAQICGIEVEILKSVPLQKEPSFSKDELEKLLCQQPWYQNDYHLKDAISRIPPECLATSSDALAAIIDRGSQDGHRGVLDIYLLNVGNTLTIRNLEGLCNMRIVGYGKPMLLFSPHLRGSKLDLEDNNLRFQDLRLNCQGVDLLNTAGRRIHVDLIK